MCSHEISFPYELGVCTESKLLNLLSWFYEIHGTSWHLLRAITIWIFIEHYKIWGYTTFIPSSFLTACMAIVRTSEVRLCHVLVYGLEVWCSKVSNKCATLVKVSENPASLIHTVGFTTWSFIVFDIESFTRLKFVQMKLVRGFSSNEETATGSSYGWWGRHSLVHQSMDPTRNNSLGNCWKYCITESFYPSPRTIPEWVSYRQPSLFI
jgi:hypothetical protein